jgi:hypothetical protein
MLAGHLRVFNADPSSLQVYTYAGWKAPTLIVRQKLIVLATNTKSRHYLITRSKAYPVYLFAVAYHMREDVASRQVQLLNRSPRSTILNSDWIAVH